MAASASASTTWETAVLNLRHRISVDALRSNSLSLEVFKRQCLLLKANIDDAKTILAQTPASLNGRDFLVIYLFAFFGFEDALKDGATALVDHVHDAHVDAAFLPTLSRLLAEHQTAYLEWKATDQASLLQDMCRLYWEYELVFKLNEQHMTPEERVLYVDETKKRQKRLVDAMKSIDDMRAFSAFTPPTVFEASVVAKIQSTLKRAFWDLVAEDIAEEPPGIERLLSVFVDIREKLVMILGPGHRILDDFDDTMDPGFIAQLHTIAATGQATFWTSRCDFLIDVLAQLDSPHMEAVHRKWWTDLHESREGHAKCIYCLSYFVDHLEKLTDLVAAVRARMSPEGDP